MKDVENHRNRFNGIHTFDSPQRIPKGCQKVAAGRSPRTAPEKVISRDRTPKRVPDVRTT